MKVESVDISLLLPDFMQDDDTNRALANGINRVERRGWGDVSRLSIWNKIDELNEAELSELAYEMNVFWYEEGADIKTKRKVIKNAKKVFASLGTVYAVEQVVDDYFPEAFLQEWFDYGGKPYFFKVFSNNPQILNAQIDLFLRVLEKVKKKSAWLECIEFQMRGALSIPACIKAAEETEYLCEISQEAK